MMNTNKKAPIMTQPLKYAALFTMLATTALVANDARSADVKPDVAAAITEWAQAVEAGKLEDIMKLYDKNALMISTFAQAPLTKRSQIEDFYKKVIVNPDIEVEILESHPRQFGDVATNSGRYSLSFTQEGEEVSIPARFTFVYALKGGKWSIVEQHSSRMPVGKEKMD